MGAKPCAFFGAALGEVPEENPKEFHLKALLRSGHWPFLVRHAQKGGKRKCRSLFKGTRAWLPVSLGRRR